MNNNNLYNPYPPYPPIDTKQIKKEQIFDGMLLGAIIVGVVIFTWVFYSYKILKYSTDRVGNLMVILYGTDPKIKDSIAETEFLNFGAVNIDVDGGIAKGEMQIKPNSKPTEILSSNIISYKIADDCPDFSLDCINV